MYVIIVPRDVGVVELKNFFRSLLNISCTIRKSPIIIVSSCNSLFFLQLPSVIQTSGRSQGVKNEIEESFRSWHMIYIWQEGRRLSIDGVTFSGNGHLTYFRVASLSLRPAQASTEETLVKIPSLPTFYQIKSAYTIVVQIDSTIQSRASATKKSD